MEKCRGGHRAVPAGTVDVENGGFAFTSAVTAEIVD